MMNVEGLVLSVESPNQRFGLRSRSGPQPSTLDPQHSRPGVTLIELMIAIMIISILAAAVLGVAAVAGETAREAKTRNIVARIHTLLMEHYGTFASRRIKFRKTYGANKGVEEQIDTEFETTQGQPGYMPGNSVRRNAARSEARLYAMRELMLMEVPDRWSDVYLADLGALQPGQPFYYGQRTELSNLYLRRYLQLNPTKESESAECLYLVIMNACGDGESRTLFPESNIGDTDGDGAPEFIDGWGHPISFLRWAPGFNSDVQLSAEQLNAMSALEQTNAIAGDHDPFDLYRVDSQAFRLIPLVYSNGRDETSGVDHEDSYVTWRTTASNSMNFNTSDPTKPLISSPQLTPYVTGTPPAYPLKFFGSPDSVGGTKASTDNINNHLIGTR
jgi:prepilin-type N-terminal cleavage/methylation domain-containing protein